MKISIILASYNYERFIGETIESIVNQSKSDWEAIVVDDGSKDNSVELIRKWVAKDNRIKLYQHEYGVNKGLCETVKLGLSKASGDWIAFCETDDYWTTNHLEKVFEVINKYPDVGMIANNVEYFGECPDMPRKLAIMEPVFEALGKYEMPAVPCKDLYFKNIILTFSAFAVRKSLLEKCDFNSKIPALLDWWLWRQMSHVAKLFYIKDKITYWRIHGDSYINEQKKRDHGPFLKANNRIMVEKFGKISFAIKMIVLYKKFKCVFMEVLRRFFYLKKDKGFLRVKIFSIQICKIKL